MLNVAQRPNQEITSRAAVAVPALVIVLLLTVFATQAALAQFNVIHAFTGAADGRYPYSGLTIDRGGNLYGTTFYGGATNDGVVYKLAPAGSSWIFSPLYSFQAGSDGAYPYASLTIGPDGALYGTTYGGGGSGCGYGCGTVFRLTPPASSCKTAICSWSETVLYRFSGGADGRAPHSGVVFDQAGNLYGTTVFGGATSCNNGNGCGVVYELTRSNGGWTQSVPYSFAGGNDGMLPYSGVTVDPAGNLYGTTSEGGPYGQGTVYQLTPSGSGWAEKLLYSFTGGTDGAAPYGGLNFDSFGNLYGTASGGGSGGLGLMGIAPPVATGGTAFELSPAGGSWTFALIYTFTESGGGGLGPYANLIMDSAGNLYGAAGGGGLPPGYDGTIFELSPANGSWTYTSLHQFTGGSDGEDPFCALVFDAAGNLYGTATYAGAYGNGVVYQITP